MENFDIFFQKLFCSAQWRWLSVHFTILRIILSLISQIILRCHDVWLDLIDGGHGGGALTDLGSW